MRHHWIAALVAAGIAVVLTACGDGGGTTPPVQASAVQCDAAANPGWCWQSTSVTGNRLNAVAFVDASHGWAVGDAGTVVLSVDGGAHWQVAMRQTRASLLSVAFRDALLGWVMADDGSVLRTTDGGRSWQSTMVDPTWNNATLRVVDAHTVLVSSGFQGLDAISHDGGQTFRAVDLSPNAVSQGGCWTWGSAGGDLAWLPGCDSAAAAPVALPAEAMSIISLASADGVHVLATTLGGVPGQILAFASADAGAHWTSVPTPPGANVVAFDGQAGWCTNVGAWWRTVDGGSTWTPVVTPSAVTGPDGQPTTNGGVLDANTIWFSAGDHVVATRDGGASWIDGHVPGESIFRTGKVLAVASSTSAVVQFEDRFYATADAGATWTPLFGAKGAYTLEPPVALHFWDRANGIELLQDGSLLRTADAGAHWTHEAGASTDDDGMLAGDLRVVSATTAWMISDFRLLTSADAGRSWTPVAFDADPQQVPQALDFIDATHGWVVALGGDVHRTDDGGKTWTKIGATANPLYLGSVRELRFRDAMTGLLVMSGGSIERTTDGGATWQETGIYETGPMTAHVQWTDAQTAWMVDNNVFKSTDGGQTWVIQSDKLPGAFADAAGLRDVFFVDANHGWLVGRSQVYATTDGGATWTQQEANIGAMLDSVFFIDGQTGWIGTSDGRFLATGTGGIGGLPG